MLNKYGIVLCYIQYSRFSAVCPSPPLWCSLPLLSYTPSHVIIYSFFTPCAFSSTWNALSPLFLCLGPWFQPTSSMRPPPFRTFSSVQLLSHVWLFATPWITARQASLSLTNSRSLLKLISIELVMPSSHIILCHPLLLLPPIPPSLFQWVNSSHEMAKVLEFQLQHQSFQWSPRTDLL